MLALLALATSAFRAPNHVPLYRNDLYTAEGRAWRRGTPWRSRVWTDDRYFDDRYRFPSRMWRDEPYWRYDRYDWPGERYWRDRYWTDDRYR